MSRVIFGASALLAVIGAGSLIAAQRAQGDPPDAPAPEGFRIEQVRFDESMGGKRPTPRIPRTWRFVGVSNGQKVNSNNLWFQDQHGTIYAVGGFNDGGQFIMQTGIQRLEAGQ